MTPDHPLYQLRRVAEGLNPKYINMSTWSRQTRCGTTACLLGWAAHDSWFLANTSLRLVPDDYDPKERIVPLTVSERIALFDLSPDYSVIGRGGWTNEDTYLFMPACYHYLNEEGKAIYPKGRELKRLILEHVDFVIQRWEERQQGIVHPGAEFNSGVTPLVTVHLHESFLNQAIAASFLEPGFGAGRRTVGVDDLAPREPAERERELVS